jgi:hypothetical protein
MVTVSTARCSGYPQETLKLNAKNQSSVSRIRSKSVKIWEAKKRQPENREEETKNQDNFKINIIK